MMDIYESAITLWHIFYAAKLSYSMGENICEPEMQIYFRIASYDSLNIEHSTFSGL